MTHHHITLPSSVQLTQTLCRDQNRVLCASPWRMSGVSHHALPRGTRPAETKEQPLDCDSSWPVAAECPCLAIAQVHFPPSLADACPLANAFSCAFTALLPGLMVQEAAVPCPGKKWYFYLAPTILTKLIFGHRVIFSKRPLAGWPPPGGRGSKGPHLPTHSRNPPAPPRGGSHRF